MNIKKQACIANIGALNEYFISKCLNVNFKLCLNPTFFLSYLKWTKSTKQTISYLITSCMDHMTHLRVSGGVSCGASLVKSVSKYETSVSERMLGLKGGVN